MLSSAHAADPPPTATIISIRRPAMRVPCTAFASPALRTPQAVRIGLDRARATIALVAAQLAHLDTLAPGDLVPLDYSATATSAATVTEVWLPVPAVRTALEAEMQAARHSLGRWICTAADAGVEG